MAFMVAGCLLVYFSHRVTTSGWLDAFNGDYAWIGTSTLVFMLVLGAVVIALSSLGCFGALLQQKLLLTIYALVLVLTLVLFGVVAVGGFLANSKAADWKTRAYPVTRQEASLGANFNRLYCSAQVPHYCQDATVHTVLEMFNVSLTDHFLDSTTNFTNVCSAVTLAAISDVCDVCHLVARYRKYAMVLDWSETSCPRTSTKQVWCGGFLLNATAADDMVANAPFMECRSVFYELVAKWTHVVLVASIICIIAAMAVLAMTGVLWRNVHVARREKARRPAPPAATMYHYGDPNVGYSQRSDATNNGAFSMYSTAPRNLNAAVHRRYDSPF
uniref:Tetraspanin n=1 Tax=Hyaloperonospora arabidopsidis (strain Emoy2) TaxID=559515 RepID=M4BN63_HYAAE